MRLAVTGAAGDLGTALLRRLLEREAAEEVVAIDRRPPRVTDARIEPVIEDVRSPRLGSLVEGCEALVHLAFVLIPGRDRAEAHSVNLDGTARALEAASGAGVRRLVVASSLSAHGTPRRSGDPAPVDERSFPAGDRERFYFAEKSQQEHLLDFWRLRNPDSPPVLTRLRPGFVWGPDVTNPAYALIGAPLAIVPDDGGRTQLVHQDDVADAFIEAACGDHPGPFLITTEDSVSVEEIAEITRGRVLRVPVPLAERALDLAAALRLSPVDSEWAVSGDRPANPSLAARELGWRASLSSRESALALLWQRGRPVHFGADRPRAEVLERALEVPTRMLREAAGLVDGGERNPGLAGCDLEAALGRAEHDFIRDRGLAVHLEVHAAGAGAPTVVFHHGLGDHVRRFTPLAGRLVEAGYNAVLVDRPGHGLSEGRRGHCPLPRALELVERSARYARERFGGPVAMLGDSLGGITLWYALTRELDVEAAACHCIGNPAVDHDPSMAWKRGLSRALGALAPLAPVPVREIADYAEVALHPGTQAGFDAERDRLFNFTVTAASVASYLDFRPPRPWSEVRAPVLVLIGAEDRMVTREFTERVLEAEPAPPRTTYEVLPGQGHQVFLDHLAEAFPRLESWLERALAGA